MSSIRSRKYLRDVTFMILERVRENDNVIEISWHSVPTMCGDQISHNILKTCRNIRKILSKNIKLIMFIRSDKSYFLFI